MQDCGEAQSLQTDVWQAYAPRSQDLDRVVLGPDQVAQHISLMVHDDCQVPLGPDDTVNANLWVTAFQDDAKDHDGTL